MDDFVKCLTDGIPEFHRAILRKHRAILRKQYEHIGLTAKGAKRQVDLLTDDEVNRYLGIKQRPASGPGRYLYRSCKLR